MTITGIRPLDETEAVEAGVLLDDPEALSDDE